MLSTSSVFWISFEYWCWHRFMTVIIIIFTVIITILTDSSFQPSHTRVYAEKKIFWVAAVVKIDKEGYTTICTTTIVKFRSTKELIQINIKNIKNVDRKYFVVVECLKV